MAEKKTTKRKPPAIDIRKLHDAIGKTLTRGLEKAREPGEKKFEVGEGVEDPKEE